ncbi:hypothetical protein CDAR_311501 [Caerostris darwini]|uniref:Uncharacterized protein n=1 Tax=Caerostris darwini TaxID=1538125 RepID=A0AAV4UTK5_9ARAC|nr:hypothetical protein CDAR_311501 [Caerostris darwini]
MQRLPWPIRGSLGSRSSAIPSVEQPQGSTFTAPAVFCNCVPPLPMITSSSVREDGREKMVMTSRACPLGRLPLSKCSQFFEYFNVFEQPAFL